MKKLNHYPIWDHSNPLAIFLRIQNTAVVLSAHFRNTKRTGTNSSKLQTTLRRSHQIDNKSDLEP